MPLGVLHVAHYSHFSPCANLQPKPEPTRMTLLPRPWTLGNTESCMDTASGSGAGGGGGGGGWCQPPSSTAFGAGTRRGPAGRGRRPLHL